jgi:hypothetical protein
MKFYIIFPFCFLCLLSIVSCKKNTYQVTERTTNNGAAQVKLGYFSAYTTTPNTILYINDIPVSNTLTAPVSFPGGGLNMNGLSNGDYLFIKPGTAKIQGFRPIPGTGNIMTKLFEFNQEFSANTNYTFYITDTATNTAGFSLEDTKVKPDSGFARFKFVNIMPNVPAVDLYKGTTVASATLVQANVNYKASSPSFDLPLPIADSFYIRPAGAAVTTQPIARRFFALSNQRIYTMLARGYNGTALATLAPNISVIVNQ